MPLHRKQPATKSNSFDPSMTIIHSIGAQDENLHDTVIRSTAISGLLEVM